MAAKAAPTQQQALTAGTDRNEFSPLGPQGSRDATTTTQVFVNRADRLIF